MCIAHSTDDLSEECLGFLLADVVILNVVVELPPVSQLHYNEYIVGGVQYFVELNYILVANKLKDFYLSLHLSRPIPTLEIIFLFFIFRLFIIFTATLTPVRSCLASTSQQKYISPLRTRLSLLSCLGCNDQCEPLP